MKTVTIPATYSIAVQFSGAAKLYPYTVPATAFARDELGMTVPTKAGDRVVVPTKLKADGTVTLTIATIVDTTPEELTALIGTEKVKPVIQVLAGWAIEEATAHVRLAEAAQAEALKAKVG